MFPLKPFLLMYGITACIIASSYNLHAQEDPDASFAQRAPAGLILSDSLAVAEINLAEINVAATFESIIATGAPVPPQFSMTVGAFLDGVRDAGAENIYLTVPSRWLVEGGVCVMIPCRDVQAVQRLVSDVVALMAGQFPYVVIERESLVIVCPKSAASHFESSEESGSGDAANRFDAAIASVQSLPHRVAFALPQDLRQELTALWPQEVTLAGAIAIQPSQLVQEVRSVGLGFALPPRTQVEMQVVCEDADGAEFARQQFQQLIDAVPEGMTRPEIAVDGERVTVGLSVEQIHSFQNAVFGPSRQRASVLRTMNNLKQLALAFHNYADVHLHFPGKYTADANRRPLLSWRVALLPYIEQAALYKKFKQDEPWDSAHNRALIAEMPGIFTVTGDSLPLGKTRIRLPIVEGGLWDGEGPPRTFKDVTDGTSNTIWIAVAPESAAVEWTKPDDWQLDAANLIDSFIGDAERVPVGILDGSVRSISRETSAEIVRALLTMAGGEVVDYDEVK